jgi:ATP/maltotriose-dependent transcriptional regulator MalT
MCASLTADAGAMGGAAWTGIGALSSSRPMSHKHYATLFDMAVRTNEAMVLDARNGVLDHARQAQLSAARRTTHRSHSNQQSRAHPVIGIIDFGPVVMR